MAVKKKLNEDIDTVTPGSTPAATSVMSKTVALNQITNAILGAQGDDWTQLANVLAQVGTEADAIQDDSAEKNAATVAMKGAVKEDLAIIFGDNEELSESFKEKLSTLFEAAVNNRVSLEIETVKAELQEQFEIELEKVTEELIENVDSYVSYAAQEWLKENEVAIDNSLRSEISEEFISGLRALFLEHNISVPEEKEDLVEELISRNNDLEDKLNSTIEDNLELSNIAESVIKENVIYKLSEGLPVTSIEKFKQLSESVDFDGDVEEFTSKLETIKETYLKSTPSTKPTSKLVTEEIGFVDTEAPKSKSGTMNLYSGAISRALKSNI